MERHLSDIPNETFQLIRERLDLFNEKRTAEEGQYFIIFPSDKSLYYTLWFFAPSATYYSYIFISNLELNAFSSANKAIRILSNSSHRLSLDDNIEPVQHNGDDIIMFGKYRSRHLQDIYAIDPGYVSWLADKYEPQVKSEFRFKELAVNYKKVYLDLQAKRISRNMSGAFVGKPGEKMQNLKLSILKVRVEDDPYKTRLVNGVEYFYVDQLITATDTDGNLFSFTIKAADRSLVSRTLAPGTHTYQKGDTIEITSSKILKHFESHDRKYTKIGYLKIKVS